MVLMLATQYNANVKIVTRNIVVSTLLSVITIPIVVATMLLQEKNMNYKIYDQLPQEAKEIRIKEITVKIYEEMKEEIMEKDKEKEKNNKEGKKIKIKI